MFKLNFGTDERICDGEFIFVKIHCLNSSSKILSSNNTFNCWIEIPSINFPDTDAIFVYISFVSILISFSLFVFITIVDFGELLFEILNSHV